MKSSASESKPFLSRSKGEISGRAGRKELYITANDPQPQMIPRPQMIPKMDRKWFSTASDP